MNLSQDVVCAQSNSFRLYQARMAHRQALLSLALVTFRYAEHNDRLLRRQCVERDLALRSR